MEIGETMPTQFVMLSGARAEYGDARASRSIPGMPFFGRKRFQSTGLTLSITALDTSTSYSHDIHVTVAGV
jgi:hypothetical protein